MTGPHVHHAHHPHPHHHPKYHHVTIDGTGTTSYPTPQKYENEVLKLLHRMHHTHTGAAVFHEFEGRTHHLMRVIPLEGVFNAFAGANDLRHATEKGRVERSGANGSVLHDGGGHSIVGLGGGSDSTVSFTPLTFSKFCSAKQPGHKSGAQPDEVLFHEMIHAMRQMRGVWNPLPLAYLYDTEEEFYAIVLANIYASETGRAIDIRSDHHGFEHLTTDTNVKFLPKKDPSDYRYRLIAKFVHKEPRLAVALSHIKGAAFNPIRRFFELQRTLVHVPSHNIH